MPTTVDDFDVLPLDIARTRVHLQRDDAFNAIGIEIVGHRHAVHPRSNTRPLTHNAVGVPHAITEGRLGFGSTFQVVSPAPKALTVHPARPTTLRSVHFNLVAADRATVFGHFAANLNATVPPRLDVEVDFELKIPVGPRRNQKRIHRLPPTADEGLTIHHKSCGTHLRPPGEGPFGKKRVGGQNQG